VCAHGCGIDVKVLERRAVTTKKSVQLGVSEAAECLKDCEGSLQKLDWPECWNAMLTIVWYFESMQETFVFVDFNLFVVGVIHILQTVEKDVMWIFCSSDYWVNENMNGQMLKMC